MKQNTNSTPQGTRSPMVQRIDSLMHFRAIGIVEADQFERLRNLAFVFPEMFDKKIAELQKEADFREQVRYEDAQHDAELFAYDHEEKFEEIVGSDF